MLWKRLGAAALAVAAAAPAAGSTSHATPALPDPPAAGLPAGKVPADVAPSDDGAATTRSLLPGRDPLFVLDREPAASSGRNDEPATAQHLRRLGTSPGLVTDAVVVGRVADVNTPPIAIGPFPEDDGAIPLANPTGLSTDVPRVHAAGSIGDGPHGSVGGDGSGDFDFYAVTGATAGQQLTVDIDAVATGAALDPVVAVVDASGAIVAFNDDSPEFDSFLQVELPADGDYAVAVAAFGSLPRNPFDSGSGTGATSEGAYEITLAFEHAEDLDVFRVDLRRGDVLGAAVSGDAGRVVEVLDPATTLVMGSGRDQTVFYPDASPLKVAGNATLDHVAAVDGPHYLRVSRGVGTYTVDLLVRRPGLEADGPGARQVLFLDFDGAFVDPSTFGTDSGTLSPLADFIAGWGLGPDDEDALIDAILATFTENLVDDPHERGGNENFDVEIRNSRDHADPWGEPDVTRIIIGGTREELDFPTVGLAESVDPGNFAPAETGVVLLDQASAPAGSGLRTINDFAQPDTDMVGLVGRVLGFIASHEAGHLLGNWHTLSDNGVVSTMDTFDLTQLGLGPDLVFGTADDVDVDFVTDELTEGFIGAEDTLARVAHALTTRH